MCPTARVHARAGGQQTERAAVLRALDANVVAAVRLGARNPTIAILGRRAEENAMASQGRKSQQHLTQNGRGKEAAAGKAARDPDSRAAETDKPISRPASPLAWPREPTAATCSTGQLAHRTGDACGHRGRDCWLAALLIFDQRARSRQCHCCHMLYLLIASASHRHRSGQR